MKGQKNRKVNIPDIISVLPLRDAVLYPELMIPLVVGRDRSEPELGGVCARSLYEAATWQPFRLLPSA